MNYKVRRCTDKRHHTSHTTGKRKRHQQATNINLCPHSHTDYNGKHQSYCSGIADKSTPEAEAAAAFIQAIKDMKKRFGIGDTIPEIREEDIPKLTHYADKEANPLYPVPVLMNANELETFYYDLMEKPDKKKEDTL